MARKHRVLTRNQLAAIFASKPKLRNLHARTTLDKQAGLREFVLRSGSESSWGGPHARVEGYRTNSAPDIFNIDLIVSNDKNHLRNAVRGMYRLIGSSKKIKRVQGFAEHNITKRWAEHAGAKTTGDGRFILDISNIRPKINRLRKKWVVSNKERRR